MAKKKGTFPHKFPQGKSPLIGHRHELKARRINAFEKGLVNWIEENYDPDTHLNGQWSTDRVSFE